MKILKDLLYKGDKLSLSRVLFLSLFCVIFKNLLFNEEILNPEVVETIFTVLSGYVFLSKTKINGGK